MISVSWLSAWEHWNKLTKTQQKRRQLDSQIERRVTRSMSRRDAARAAVFYTTELLEHILLFLPASTLYARAQRLSRHFRTVIRFSPNLCRAMFLRAVPGPHERRLQTHRAPQAGEKSLRHFTTTALNPMLEQLQVEETLFVDSPVVAGKEPEPHEPQWACFHSAIDLRVRDSRWQQYLTNPPSEKVCALVVLGYDGFGEGTSVQVRFEKPGGIRLEELVVEILRHRTELTNGRRCVYKRIRDWLIDWDRRHGPANRIKQIILDLEDVNLA